VSQLSVSGPLSHTHPLSQRESCCYRGVLAGPLGAAVAPSARAALFSPGVNSILKQLVLGVRLVINLISLSSSTKGYSSVLNGRFKGNHALMTRVAGAMG